MSKRLISICLAILITVSLSLPTQAYSLIGYKLKGGVGNYNAGTSRYYWYDSDDSVVNAQISNINTAISNERVVNVMKRQYLISTLVFIMAFLISGCTQITSTSKPQSTKSDLSLSVDSPKLSSDNVYKIVAHPDWVKSSKDLKALYNNSSFVAEIKVDNTKAQVEQNGRISTIFKPTIINVFKGSYNGEDIISLGGIIDYSDYVNKVGLEIKNNFSSENTVPDKVEYTFGDIPIVKSGDSMIVFCNNTDGNYSITNSFEGLFKIDGNSLTNDAIRNTPLIEDICSNSNSTLRSNATMDSSTINESVQITKSAFISKIKALKN